MFEHPSRPRCWRLARFASLHGHTIACTYQVGESAWNGGKDSGDNRATLKAALDDAWQGQYKVLIIWALDRLTRAGAEEALRLIRLFRERGVVVLSHQEPWLNGTDEIMDVLIALAGWQARYESNRRSERIKQGIARRKAEGGHVGRKPEAKDTAVFSAGSRR